ncbi:unnamed protein product [Trichobilharzia regenti]|nr:unnamed protein product [Trichobilharzia regenti]
MIMNRLTDQTKAIHIPSSLESYYLMNTAQTEKINNEVCENNLSTESLSSSASLQQLDPFHPTNAESNATTSTPANAHISSVHGDTKIMNLDNKQIEMLSSCLLSALSMKDLINTLPNALFPQQTSYTTSNNTTLSNSGNTSSNSKDKTISSNTPHSGVYSTTPTTINDKSSKLTAFLKTVKDKKLLTAVNSYQMNAEEVNIGIATRLDEEKVNSSKVYKDNKDIGGSLGTDIGYTESCIMPNRPTDDGCQQGGEKKQSKSDEGGMMKSALPGALTLGVNDFKQCRSVCC